MRTESEHTVFLKDYAPTPYAIAAVSLDFKIGEQTTRVRAQLTIEPRATTEPYVLRVVEAAPEAAPVTVVRTAPRATPAVYRGSDDDVVRYEPSARRVESKRSGAKTALIIAGSAGAGAGIGGLTGGKKGALIGAAIGGGAASIWEATKR